MKWPRKGIWIRLVIYLPLIGFLAWQALCGRSEPEPAPAPPITKTVVLPDGTEKDVQFITPEQAKELYGVTAKDE